MRLGTPLATKGIRSVDDTQKVDLLEKLRWLGDTIVHIRVGVMTDNPDYSLDELEAMLKQVTPPVGQYMMACMGEGDDGG